MTDKEVMRIGQSLPVLSGQYAELFQRKILNKGKYDQLLEEYREGNFFNSQIQLTFPPAKDGVSFPEFTLEFDLYFNERNDGFWGVVPVLGIECYAKEYAKLIKRLEDAIRLDFVRNRRLEAVQEILTAAWFERTELNQMEIDLQIPSLQTLANQDEEEQEKLLPQVAKPLQITQKTAYGRSEELDRMTRILKGKFGRNILLTGPSGVGKTTLVWELARQMKKRKIKGQIWETTASTLIKELMRDTGWQENFALLCRELAGSNDLLFVRNLMELFEVGKSEGNDVSMAEFLRNYLDRGEVRLLSECSAEELARIQLKSPNFLRLFNTINLEEPKEKLETIIQQKVKNIARLQKVQISTEAIREVVRLNKRYTPYAGLPGKPIRFLESILLHQKKIKKGEIGPTEIIRYFCEETGLPLFMVDPSLPMFAPEIKEKFNRQVFDQKKAVDGVVDMLVSVKTALTRTGKPIASFLFAGPTGVGKTELAKVLAEFMFGNRDRIVRFDMSEFSSPYAVLRLLGVDYFNDGLLTSAVRRDPFCVLLFDEIEKAHANFYDLLLQILSEGRLTDSSGQLVNFCSAIIIMTSNIGAGNLQQRRISLHKSIDAEDINQHFISAVHQFFRPELVNRIDQIIAFSPLTERTMRHIVEREIGLLKQREGIRFRKMDLDIQPDVYDFLARQGYDPQYGARHLQRVIRDQLIAPLSKTLNVHESDDQLIVTLSLKNEKIDISVQADPMGLDLMLEELEKISNADHASRLRRQVIQFQEGHGYVRLLSELDMLEHRKKKEKQKFWQNLAQSTKYSHLLAARQRLEQTRDRIEALELTLNLSCLGQERYQPAILEEIKAWESDFLRLKKDFLALMEPQYSFCHFAVYGVNLMPILEFYLHIFRAVGYEISAHAVWFQEAYYQRITAVNATRAEDEYEHLPMETPYLKSPVPLGKEQIPLLAPEKGGALYGFELTVSGPNAYLFLKPEAGFQTWKLKPPEENTYAIFIENKVHPTPDKIHRRDFYARKPIRRIIGPATIKDNTFDINRELKFSDWPSFLLEYLEEHFNNSLDAYVL
jgi:ATP-dependent Clp protease ATP-binding subunit ClpA